MPDWQANDSKVCIIAGLVCLDIIPELGSGSFAPETPIVSPGKLINLGPAVISTGGPVSNTGIALHKLGEQVRLMGKIGDDIFGKIINDIIGQYNPHLIEKMITANGQSSSYTIVINPPGVDRMFMHSAGVNDSYSSDDVRGDDLRDGWLFHFGYPPLMKSMYEEDGRHLIELFRKAKVHHLVTSLDMAMPDPAAKAGQADWRLILRKVLPFVDMFMPSLEEILFMLRRSEYERLTKYNGDILSIAGVDLLTSLSDELLDMGCCMVLLKLGEHGLYLRSSADPERLKLMLCHTHEQIEAWVNREMYITCYEVQVVGTNGAGDSTIAGFISGLRRGLSPSDALQGAVGVGACNVEKSDATSGIVKWDAVMKRMANGWAYRSPTIPLPGWNSVSSGRVWTGPNDQTRSD